MNHPFGATPHLWYPLFAKDDEDVEIVAVNGENCEAPGGALPATLRRLVPPEAPRLVPPETQGDRRWDTHA